MRFVLVTSFLLLFITSYVKAQQPPKALDVLKTFFSRYAAKEMNSPSFQLEKRKGSWFVCAFEIVASKPVKRNAQLFYDAEAGIYLPLNFSLRSTGDEVDITSMISPHELYLFDLYPSYNYDGWYKDVISELESKPNMTNSELYSLARAYSVAANSLTSNQYGNSIAAEMFNSPLRENVLTEEQVNAFLNLSDKAVFLFNELAAKDPEFNTTVGSILMKAANEKMTQYHTLSVFAEKFIWKVKLPDNLYPADTLEKVKRYLSSCPDNSIFLSFGDNDFYPVLYLNANGFKANIHLVNANLLGLDRFILRATRPYFKSQPIRLSLDTNEYKGSKYEYLFFSEVNNPMLYSQVIAELKKGIELFPTKQILIKGRKKNDKQLNYDVQLKGQYILKDQIVLLDILNNLGDRKLCMISPFYDLLEDLNQYLVPNGDVLMFRN